VLYGETIGAGPARVAQSIREALAKGADRGIHIEHDQAGMLDSLSTARMLAAAVQPEAPDLVLAGLQSDDLGYGQTGVILAELLGLPHATIVMEVQAAEGGVTVKRELENGWFQKVTLPLPCVLTVQSGIRKLRYATLMGIKKAKSKPIASVPAPAISPGDSGVAVDRVYMPERSKKTEIFDGSPAEAAARLIEKLRFEARVL
jgi:electron transfer flavoprotein beta subunit